MPSRSSYSPQQQQQTTQQTPFVYQSLSTITPASPSSTPPSPLPYQAHQAREEEPKSLAEYRFNDAAAIDYLVSPIPSSNRKSQENMAVGDTGSSESPELPPTHASSQAKRCSSTLSLKQSSAGRQQAPMQTKLQSQQQQSSAHQQTQQPHHQQQLQSQQPHRDQHSSGHAAKDSSSWNLKSMGVNKTTPKHQHPAISTMHTLPSSNSAQKANTTTNPMPLQPAFPHSLNDMQQKVHKKERLRAAKIDYESRVQCFYLQLTEGCGHADCTNRFCATGQRNGCLNLHPHAAMSMAIQLASKPNHRLCVSQHAPVQDSPLSGSPRRGSDKEKGSDRLMNTETSKPFLQALFASSPFSFLTPKSQVPKQRRKRPSINASPASQEEPSSTWSAYLWHMQTCVDYILGGAAAQDHEISAPNHKANAPEDVRLNEPTPTSSSLSESSYESDSSDDLQLASRLISIDLTTAVEHVQRYRCLKDHLRMTRWLRTIFQSWEGIGSSFLMEQPRSMPECDEPIAFIDLHDVSKLFRILVDTDQDLRCMNTVDVVSESFETLLERMSMNMSDMTESSQEIQSVAKWCRALLCVSVWIGQQKLGSNKHDDIDIDDRPFAAVGASKRHLTTTTWPNVLTDKFVFILSKVGAAPSSLVRAVLLHMMASMSETHMLSAVAYLQKYLLDNFHTGPYKHGELNSMIMTAKSLELLYQANMTRSPPVVSPSAFYLEELCARLKFKDEYRIWKRVLAHGEGRHSASTIEATARLNSSPKSTRNQLRSANEQQRYTRLFLATSSTSMLFPYPFANEYQFSWFSYPFLLSPVMKRRILQIDSMSHMSLEYEDACVNHTLVVHAQRLLSEAPQMVRMLESNLKCATCPYLLLEIRREYFVTDTLQQLSRKWNDLKKPLRIKFIDGGEEGMDQGGVQKEFFGVLFEKLAAPELGLFTVDDETRLCWFRSTSNPDVRLYEMVGVLMGLAIYNGVILNLQLPNVLWKAVVMPTQSAVEAAANDHRLFGLSDLEEGWPTLASGLRQLLTWPDEVEDVFCHNYEISLDVFELGGVATYPLMPNGASVAVTNANREAYVRDYCTYFMYSAHRDSLLAVRRGIRSVIHGHAIHLCTAEELSMVACGLRGANDPTILDLAELEEAAGYDDGYSTDHPTIRQFWSVAHSLTADQKRKLLLFVTASDRTPIGGLKELTIVVQRNGPDSDRLPTALTCFSRLLLPQYATREKLHDRLVTAIENATGFGLV